KRPPLTSRSGVVARFRVRHSRIQFVQELPISNNRLPELLPSPELPMVKGVHAVAALTDRIEPLVPPALDRDMSRMLHAALLSGRMPEIPSVKDQNPRAKDKGQRAKENGGGRAGGREREWAECSLAGAGR